MVGGKGLRRSNSHTVSITQEERHLLNHDLGAILGGGVPREYGVMPKTIGAFERIAPSKTYDDMQRIVRSGPRG